MGPYRTMFLWLCAIIGSVITIGSMLLDVYQLSTMGLSVATWVIIGLSIFFLSVIGLVGNVIADNHRLRNDLMTLKSIQPNEKVLGTTWPSKSIVNTLLDQQQPDLKLTITGCGSHKKSEIGIGGKVHESNRTLEFETTFIPSSRLEIRRISLELDGIEQELTLLGPPIYAETIRLPLTCEREETRILRFELPHKYSRKTNLHGKIKVLAGGKYWYSEDLEMP